MHGCHRHKPPSVLCCSAYVLGGMVIFHRDPGFPSNKAKARSMPQPFPRERLDAPWVVATVLKRSTTHGSRNCASKHAKSKPMPTARLYSCPRAWKESTIVTIATFPKEADSFFTGSSQATRCFRAMSWRKTLAARAEAQSCNQHLPQSHLVN